MLIEGLSPDEIVALPDAEIRHLLRHGEPITFRIGGAELLARIEIGSDRLSVQVAHVDGEADGALVALGALCERFARSRGLHEVEYLVNALTCARPNERLRAVLDRRGFVPVSLPDRGSVLRAIRRV